jgi:hypothetical protein
VTIVAMWSSDGAEGCQVRRHGPARRCDVNAHMGRRVYTRRLAAPQPGCQSHAACAPCTHGSGSRHRVCARVWCSAGLLCTGSQFNLRRVNILHRAGYQMDIRNVSLCCISLSNTGLVLVSFGTVL